MSPLVTFGDLPPVAVCCALPPRAQLVTFSGRVLGSNFARLVPMEHETEHHNSAERTATDVPHGRAGDLGRKCRAKQ